VRVFRFILANGSDRLLLFSDDPRIAAVQRIDHTSPNLPLIFRGKLRLFWIRQSTGEKAPDRKLHGAYIRVKDRPLAEIT